MIAACGQAFAGAQQRGRGAAILGNTATTRLHYQARQAGMQRIASHLAAGGAGGAQLREQIVGVGDSRLGRRIQPFQIVETA